MKLPLAAFLFFTEPNFGFIERSFVQLRDRARFHPVLLPGFDFESARKGLSQWHPQRHEAVCLTQGELASIPSSLLPTSTRSFYENEMKDWFEAHRRHELVERFFAIARDLESWVRSVSPQLVVIPEDTDYIRGRLAMNLPALENTKKMIVFPFYYNLFKSYPSLSTKLADHYVVMNGSLAERLEKKGVPKERITITGFPLEEKKPEASFPKRLLFLLQGLPNEEAIVSDVRRAADLTGYEVILRAHPTLESRQATIEEDIERSAIVVAQSSSGLLKGLAAGRPIAIAQYGPGPNPLWLSSDQKWVFEFSSRTSLTNILQKIAVDNRDEFCPISFCSEDEFSNTVNRVADSLCL